MTSLVPQPKSPSEVPKGPVFRKKGLKRDQEFEREEPLKFSSDMKDDLLLEKLQDNSFYQRKNQKSLVLLAERSYE